MLTSGSFSMAVLQSTIASLYRPSAYSANSNKYLFKHRWTSENPKITSQPETKWTKINTSGKLTFLTRNHLLLETFNCKMDVIFIKKSGPKFGGTIHFQVMFLQIPCRQISVSCSRHLACGLRALHALLQSSNWMSSSIIVPLESVSVQDFLPFHCLAASIGKTREWKCSKSNQWCQHTCFISLQKSQIDIKNPLPNFLPPQSHCCKHYAPADFTAPLVWSWTSSKTLSKSLVAIMKEVFFPTTHLVWNGTV